MYKLFIEIHLSLSVSFSLPLPPTSPYLLTFWNYESLLHLLLPQAVCLFIYLFLEGEEIEG